MGRNLSITVVFFMFTLSIQSCDSDSKRQTANKIEKQEGVTKSKPKNSLPISRNEKTKAIKRNELKSKVNLGQIDYDIIKNGLLHRINKDRIKKGLPPFSQSKRLTKAAKIHNDYMVLKDVLDHEEVGTRTPTMMDRIKTAGGGFRTVGENIQYEGFSIQTINGVESILSPTYGELVDGLWQNWRTSPVHYKNIVNPEFVYIGTALKWSDQKAAVFATQLYGG